MPDPTLSAFHPVTCKLHTILWGKCCYYSHLTGGKLEAYWWNLPAQHHRARRYGSRKQTKTTVSPACIQCPCPSWYFHWFQQRLTPRPPSDNAAFWKITAILLSLLYLAPCNALIWVFPDHQNIPIPGSELNP